MGRVTTLRGTTLTRGEVVPGTPLVDATSGKQVRAWDFRGRTALVLCFLHARCRACEIFAHELAAEEEEIRLTAARTFAVLPVPGRSGLPVLVDVEGRAAERFLEGDLPAIVMTDRYAAAWETYPVLEHAFPPVSEVVRDLWHLATTCEECGIIAWPS